MWRGVALAVANSYAKVAINQRQASTVRNGLVSCRDRVGRDSGAAAVANSYGKVAVTSS